MSGTFSSFGSALSALRYNRVAMDTASNNVANANTAGYTRRMAVAQATGAPAVPALWSTWNGTAGGVEVGGIERMVDPLLVARSRTEHATLSFLDTRSASLVRFETTLSEPGENGVAAALSAFKAGWHDVANNPGDQAARSQLLGRAETLAASINSQAAAVATEWSDQRVRLDSVVTEANQVAADLATLNQALVAADNAGTDANTLLDQRDELALRLSQLTGARTVVNEDTTATVTLHNVDLVNRHGASTLTATGGSVADPSSLTIAAQVAGAGGTTTTAAVVPTSASPLLGELGGSYEVLTQDLPGYLAELQTFASTLATDVNAMHAAGYTEDGSPGVAFFSTSPSAPSALLELAITDPRLVAASSDPSGALDAGNATAIGTADLGGGLYRSLITDFGVDVASAKRVAGNQGVLTAQVDASRESLSGVNIDEEMVNLLAAQRAYEGASRVITTLDSVLDTLINRTGITR